MTSLLIILTWFMYCSLEGFREGYYWHYRNLVNDNKKFEIHPIFYIQRGLVLFVMGLFLLTIMSTIQSIFFIFYLMCVFSFIHNGVYYTTRNILDGRVYKLKWVDHSTTSTAIWTKFLTFRNRTIMFIIGMVGILILTLF